MCVPLKLLQLFHSRRWDGLPDEQRNKKYSLLKHVFLHFKKTVLRAYCIGFLVVGVLIFIVNYVESV